MAAYTAGADGAMRELTVDRIMVTIETSIVVAERHELLSRNQTGTAYYDAAVIRLRTLKKLWENITGEEYHPSLMMTL